MRHRYLKSLGLLLPSLLAVSAVAEAAPVKRVQFDLRGDFIVAGNTLGQDCAADVPAPLIGTVSNCGTFLPDTNGGYAIDVLWRREADGSFVANQTVLPSQARSRSFVDLTNRTVRYARLYWSAFAFEACPAATPQSCPEQVDTAVSFIGPDGVTRAITADSQWSVDSRYQASADVTSILQAAGTGGYDVTGVDSFKPFNLDSGDVYAGWSLIVVYENPVESLRNITLFDGFDFVRTATDPATGTISGFKVPTGTGYDAKLGVVAYEGDQDITGDFLKFNGVAVSNGQNTATNIFNSTRSNLGGPLTNAGDRPQLSGTARSMGGVDFDVFDIKPTLTAGATQATFEAGTKGDFYFINAFVTSIATLAPDLEGVKSVKDLDGGTTLPGDTLEYKIVVTNNGSDNAVNSVFDDPLPNGVTFVPGSLKLDSKVLTDKSGDDQGELVAGATPRVVVRPFTGAAAGVIEKTKTTTITFQVKVNPTFAGSIANQAKISASGENGDPKADYPTDGLQSEPGAQPTTILVEICDASNAAACPSGSPLCDTGATPNQCAACLGDSDCGSANAPLCDLSTHTCTACTTDAACAAKDPKTPACSPSGACVLCTATNEAACKGAAPACDPATNTCVECTDSSDCKSPTAVCDTSAKKCVQCLNANDCPGASACNAATKTCVACITSNDCAGVTPICDANTCEACTTDTQCKTKNAGAPVCAGTGECVTCTPGKTDACPSDKPVCSTNNTCVACTKDDECGSGKKCDVQSNTCVGCLGSADCPASTPVCDTTTQLCVACTSDTQCKTKDPKLPVCLDGGTCGACDADTIGACAGDTPLCDTPNNTCVGCLENADCKTSGALICDPKDKTCVECATSADCKGGTPICDPDKRTCTPCTSNAECKGKDAALPFCLEDKGSCVACLPGAANACADGVCDAATNTCVECNADDDCKDPKKPACNPGKKTCVECTETNDDACKGSKPTCDTGSNTCVGCNEDTDCVGDKPVCDTKAHTCIGCKTDEECAGKDAKLPVCNDTGACVACTPDKSELCEGATPTCDPGSFQCVGCVSNDDCTDNAKPECFEGTCKPGNMGGAAGKGGSDTEEPEPAAGTGGAAGRNAGAIIIAGGACSFGGPSNGGLSGAAVGLGFLALVATRRRKRS